MEEGKKTISLGKPALTESGKDSKRDLFYIHNLKSQLEKSPGLEAIFKGKGILGFADKDQYIAYVLNYVKNNKNLQIEGSSLLNCIVKAATLGLPVGDVSSYVYLVPRVFSWKVKDEFGKESWGKETRVCLDISFLGYKVILFRDPNIVNIDVFEVYKHELDKNFICERGLNKFVKYIPDFSIDRKKEDIVVYIACVIYSNGRFEWDSMTQEDVDYIKDKYATYEKKGASTTKEVSSVWLNHPIQMALKTVAKRLCKQIPFPDMQKAIVTEDEQFDVNDDKRLLQNEPVERSNEVIVNTQLIKQEDNVSLSHSTTDIKLQPNDNEVLL